ncbi:MULTISPECIES: RBBP9/YdeN family alpha/beta hydrolase [Massilia]|uniref:Alpha/beta hydrolase n=1 Tax=Massilia aurea TaxID=373040 RepID=A0A422QHR4_9BURK|nr:MULTISPECIES: alpha/beta hydrolase [Massilia]MDY0960501.1 alpha/beta hydrolase [Massilia sp. CFBP9026]RNF29497.1 alpha/beta hydrolase [Massilia aurea]
MKCDVLILPGLWNSGPRHWQSLWHERNPHWRRAAHRDWTNPHCDEWVAELDAAIADCQGAPILVAHSLGCMLVAHWALSGSPLKVAGAFLVAPSDVEAASYPADLNCWAPIPLQQLPFPSVVVGSANDPFASPARTGAFAGAWGSRLVEIGDAGHLNSDSGHGDWPEGLRLLEQFCDEVSGT